MNLPTKLATVIILGLTSSGLLAWALHINVLPGDKTLQLVEFFIILTVIILILWLLFYLIFIQPIKYFNKVIKIILSGNLADRLKIESNDEVGELAKNINAVIDNTASALQNMANSLRDVKFEKEKLAQNVRELAESEAKDEALLASLGNGLIVTDEKGNIIKVNKAFEKILGWTQAEVLGKPLTQVVPKLDGNGVPIPDKERFLTAVLQGESFSADLDASFYYLRKDGTKFPVSLMATPITLDDKVIGAVETFRDITREKEIDRMKTEFISLASHQLRTPLSAIRWLAELLSDETVGKLTAEQKEVAKNINLSAERMVDLVNALLNMSRIESGRIMIVPEPTDLIELVSGIITDLQTKIRERSQNLAIKIPAKLPIINLDPRLVRQVYLNLLTNAIKYSPKGGVISIEIYVEGDSVISKISDQGFGIPQSDQSKLFQKFFRAKNILKVETDGTGLGLYLVKAIVESSKGKIWFESTEGKGTTFWFSLPLAGIAPKEGEVRLD